MPTMPVTRDYPPHIRLRAVYFIPPPPPVRGAAFSAEIPVPEHGTYLRNLIEVCSINYVIYIYNTAFSDHLCCVPSCA